MSTTITLAEEPTFELMLPGESIPEGTAQKPSPWVTFRQEAERLKKTAETLNITDVNDKHGMALARATRLSLRQVRLSVEKRHEEEKRFYLEGGRKVDAVKNMLIALISPLEKRLLAQEEFAEREAIRIEEELRAARIVELSPFLNGPVAVDLGKLDADSYATMLDNARTLHEMKLKMAREIEEKRLAAEKAEAEERERIRQENDRLKAEAETREAEAKREAERITEERKAERAIAEALLRKEREAAAARERAMEAERQAERARLAEVARIEREAAEKAARIEREKMQAEADRREAELRKEREAAAEAKRIADMEAAAERERLAEVERKLEAERQAIAKAEADRRRAEEAKAKADALAAKKAAAAPDVEKLRALDIPQINLTNAAAGIEYASLRMDFLSGVRRLIDAMEGGAK